jgi:flagellar hook-basal body complex protein FliE
MTNLLQKVLGQPSLRIEAPKLPTFDSATKAGNPGEFQSLLADAINRVEDARLTARTSVDRFLAGENEEIHNVVLNTQRSEIAFEAFLQVRNKVVNAYQEIMRMQM